MIHLSLRKDISLSSRATRPFSSAISASHSPLQPPGNKLILWVMTSGAPGFSFSSCSLVLLESQPSLIINLMGCEEAGLSLLDSLIKTVSLAEVVTFSLSVVFAGVSSGNTVGTFVGEGLPLDFTSLMVGDLATTVWLTDGAGLFFVAAVDFINVDWVFWTTVVAGLSLAVFPWSVEGDLIRIVWLPEGWSLCLVGLAPLDEAVFVGVGWTFRIPVGECLSLLPFTSPPEADLGDLVWLTGTVCLSLFERVLLGVVAFTTDGVVWITVGLCLPLVVSVTLAVGDFCLVAGVGKTVWLMAFGLRVSWLVCLSGRAVVFGFERVNAALALVTSLPVESLFSLVVVWIEGNGVRRRSSPRVNNILIQQLWSEKLLLQWNWIYVTVNLWIPSSIFCFFLCQVSPGNEDRNKERAELWQSWMQETLT